MEIFNNSVRGLRRKNDVFGPLLLVCLLLLQVLFPLKSLAIGAYPSSQIANIALRYVGQWGGNACKDAGRSGYTGGVPGGQKYDGQCRAFVNCVVKIASSGTQWIGGGGGDYYVQLEKHGRRINETRSLTKGDVIQIGQGIHTFIIVGLVRGNTFRVVDSNHNSDEIVRTYDRSFSLDSTTRAYRLGMEPQSTALVQSQEGVGTRMLGDVNGDGLDDAVVFFKDTGTAMVAPALNSGGFVSPQSWSYGHSNNAGMYRLGDVNGDGRKDLVAYFPSQGRWSVSLSSGSGFWAPTDWAYGHGVGTSKQWVSDVNGDKRSDIITFDKNTGDWWVSLSSGSGFWAPQRWISGHGVGSSDQQVGDFDGDGLADSATWFSNGAWYIGRSSGASFFHPTQWSAGHEVGSSERVIGDVNGDNKDDIAYFYAPTGHWKVTTSSGSGFWAPTDWAYGHGVGTTERLLAKVNKDGLWDVVTFDKNTGDWWVSLSSGSGFWAPQRWISGHGKGS